jgi:hypothetical protein
MAATSKAETTHGLGLRQLLDFERKGHIKTEATIPTKAQADELYAAVNAEYMRRRKEVPYTFTQACRCCRAGSI